MVETIVGNIGNGFDFDLLVGRNSLFGNPYVMGVDGSRADVIMKHIEWLNEWLYNHHHIQIHKYSNKWVCSHLWMLAGKRIACYCDPLACHANYLARLANYYRPRKPIGDSNE